MRELIRLAAAALGRGDELCLATVVQVEGSSYRKPGARMLLASSGERAGTISGGCLEGEVARKAWWRTERGAALERYSSFFDEDEPMPYGLGCGGTVWILMERGEAARATAEAMTRVHTERVPAVVVTSLGQQPGTRAVVMADGAQLFGEADPVRAAEIARVFASRSSRRDGDLFFEYLAPPPALFLFGAGDDAQPVVEFAYALGWHVSVADGRAQLARRERFPRAARVRVIDYDAEIFPAEEPSPSVEDYVVLLTHSYEQDRALLAQILPHSPAYLGILGPRRRTERLLRDVGHRRPEAVEVRTPVGLDLGGDDPAAIALAIIAELQALRNHRQVSVTRARPVERAQAADSLEAVGD